MVKMKRDMMVVEESRPVIGASLCDDLRENNYNSESEPTEFAPHLEERLFYELEKSKKIVNVNKLAFVKNLHMPVKIPSPEP